MPRLARSGSKLAGPDNLTLASKLASVAQLCGLTLRECEIVAHLARGESTKDVAVTLGISLETVKSHIRHLLAKLGANDRTHAIALVLSAPDVTVA